MKKHLQIHGFLRRALSLALAAALALGLLPALPPGILPEIIPPTVALAEGAAAPSILRQPADATYAENATARFYVSASSPEGGYLTYQWYRSGPFTEKVNDPSRTDGTAINDPDSTGTSAVLTTKTDAPADAGTHYYYYWAEITNNAEGKEPTTTTTRIAEAKIVDRTLKDRVMYGDFQAYSNNSYSPLRSFPPSSGYWNTTHEGTPDGRDSSTGKQLEIGSGYLAANTTAAAELSAFRSSTIYQEIATVPGKIYEWKLDHGARTKQVNNSNPDVMAVVIGPAINEYSDYGDMGVTNYWNNVGSEFNGATINTRKSNLFNPPFTYDYGPNPTQVAPTCALPENGGEYNYGVNMNTHFNAIVNQVLAESGVTPANYNANNGSTFNDIDRSYSTTYGGKPYYVFISAARRNGSWFTRAGSYTVPAGQGTTVFGFVSVSSPSGAASGNILDNITFASGTEITASQEISYTGETELTVDTRSGFAYGLTELRGSSAITLYDVTASYDPDGAGATVAAGREPTSGLGDGKQWYANLGDGGVLTFIGLTPGKTYRVIGIPAAAINEGLGTNIFPADVLDDGYYMDVKIMPAKDGDDNFVAAVTAGIDETNDTANNAFITVEKSRNDVQYALLADVNGEPDTYTPAGEWKNGGGDLDFTGLEQGKTYYLVARPYGYSEIDYAAAYADGSAAIKITTPSSDGESVTGVDLKADQIERTGGGAEDTITVSDTKAGYTYALVDITSGQILKFTAAANDDEAVEFDKLEPGTTYQVVTRLTNGGVYMKGVRVYPIPGELTVSYARERIQSPAGNVPAGVEYSFDDWGTKALSTGAGFIALTEEQLSSGGTLTYRTAADNYIGAKAQPEIKLEFANRPDAPTGMSVDYAAENIKVGNGTLEYRVGASAQWTAATISENAVAFAALGWTGRSRTVYFRIPATDSAFA
ncbi:MAG: hypothetical protein LBK23_12530, partial [Oscillospiraceae bacterium]|nr:hypothetical protein [Oscillospiraceae bacterium]